MRLFHLLLLATAVAGYVINEGSTCTLYPESTTHNGAAVDDVPSIHEAFNLCGVNGTVIFTNDTFWLASVINTTKLLNVEVLVRGELKFSDNIPYWRNNAFSVIFQDQVTAWLFGGQNVTWRGEGGWINGNGQVWYTFNHNQANLHGRPIPLTVFNSTDVLLDNLVIHQPQFWATLVWKSQNVTYTNYYTNATSSDDKKYDTTNTDGYDSWESDNLQIINATIVTDDDCVAAKGNTTNLYVKNVTCHGGAGMTIGSVGQYPDMPDYVMNVTFEDVQCLNTGDCAYIKTWQGDVLNTTSNGDAGGGGSGVVKNITFRNFQLDNVGLPIQISQCIYAEEGGHGCNTSKMAIEDISWINFNGTSRYNIAASLYCSDIHPCPGIKFENVNLTSVNSTLGLPLWNTTLQYEVFQCTNLVDQNGTGVPCNHVAPDFFSQGVSGNVQ